MSETALLLLTHFFERDVCQRATAPLSNGIEIALKIQGEGPLTLEKINGKVCVEARESSKPHMTYTLSRKALEELVGNPSEDIGDIGVAILKLMAAPEPERRMHAKIQIGPFDLLRYGYLSVLPLGGASVMKFLGSKGLTGMGKIKEAISRLRE